MELPRLFTDAGVLLDVDVSQFDEPTRARHAAIVTAYHANREAQRVLDAAYEEVSASLAAVKQAESFHNKHWPPQTHYDLWKESFGRR